MSLIVIQSG